ncbi:MAG: zinc-ribbon domain containing protein [Patescibacteria group bacterium]
MTEAASQKATCKGCNKEFLIIPQEQVFYQKKGLPTPENCPDCRRKRRLSLRNERKLYKRKCDKCQKEVISTYSPESKYIIYCQECYWAHLG